MFGITRVGVGRSWPLLVALLLSLTIHVALLAGLGRMALTLPVTRALAQGDLGTAVEVLVESIRRDHAGAADPAPGTRSGVPLP